MSRSAWNAHPLRGGGLWAQEFTVDDPAYVQPWGGEIPFERFDDLVYEYACHEGNYALMNIMSGARYQESQQISGR